MTGVDAYEDSLLKQQLVTIINSSPQIANTNIVVQTESFTGAVYGIDITGYSSTGRGRTIQYALLGSNATCTLPGSYAYNVTSSPPTTACEILLEEI